MNKVVVQIKRFFSRLIVIFQRLFSILETPLRKIFGHKLAIPLLVLTAVIVQNIISTPNFFDISIKNGLLSGYIPSIMDEAGELLIITLGMTLVIAVSGGVDLSVGPIMAIAASFCGLLLNGSEYRTDVFQNPYILALFIGLLGGVLCGAFNGIMVSYLKIQPMIATLILFTAGRSIAKLITHGQTIYIMNPVYKYLGVQIPGVPIRTTILISLLFVILVTLLVKLTSLGLYVQSVGINGSAARLVGLNSNAVKFMAFVICGLLAGVAGLVGSSGVGSVNSGELGMSIEMDAILAVALGGNSLSGGKFSIAGSVIGAYTIQAITTTLYAMNVRPDQLNVFKALIIVVIIVASSEIFKERIKRLIRRILSSIPKSSKKTTVVGGCSDEN
ncbi:MAG: ABC transporter permease [Oscillospiraceae bacterium]|jgi:simple sugar transport system permease protein|nr:ABC transporter permease [Oscillospiraceae bacterium]